MAQTQTTYTQIGAHDSLTDNRSSKAKDLTPEEITARVVKLLFDQKAFDWTVQEKGALLAAVKLRLQRKRGETGQ